MQPFDIERIQMRERCVGISYNYVELNWLSSLYKNPTTSLSVFFSTEVSIYCVLISLYRSFHVSSKWLLRKSLIDTYLHPYL